MEGRGALPTAAEKPRSIGDHREIRPSNTAPALSDPAPRTPLGAPSDARVPMFGEAEPGLVREVEVPMFGDPEPGFVGEAGGPTPATASDTAALVRSSGEPDPPAPIDPLPATEEDTASHPSMSGEAAAEENFGNALEGLMRRPDPGLREETPVTPDRTDGDFGHPPQSDRQEAGAVDMPSQSAGNGEAYARALSPGDRNRTATDPSSRSASLPPMRVEGDPNAPASVAAPALGPANETLMLSSKPAFAKDETSLTGSTASAPKREIERSPSGQNEVPAFSRTLENEGRGLFEAGTAALPFPATDISDLNGSLTTAGFPTFDASALAPLPERAGVIASFILNAAMIPGWPPPRPIEGVPLRQFVEQIAKNPALSKSDMEMLLYLANMGLSRRHLKRLMRKLETAKNRSTFLLAMGVLLTNIMAGARTIREEIAALMEDIEEERRAMLSPGSGRARLSLR